MSYSRIVAGEIRNRLLLNVDDLKQSDKRLINQALSLAENTHKGHFRIPPAIDPYEEIPFIVHPMRVALIVTEELGMKYRQIVIAALLHDLVEDSGWAITTHYLEQTFGRNIALMVSIATRPAPDQEITPEQQYTTYYDRIAQATVPARLIKLAERLDNMRDLLTIGNRDYQKVYLTETLRVFLPIAQQTNAYLAAQLSLLCARMQDQLAAEIAK